MEKRLKCKQSQNPLLTNHKYWGNFVIFMVAACPLFITPLVSGGYQTFCYLKRPKT